MWAYRVRILATFFVHLSYAAWDEFEFTRENGEETENNLKTIGFPRVGDLDLAPNSLNLASSLCTLYVISFFVEIVFNKKIPNNSIL